MSHVRKPKLMDERFRAYADYLVSDPYALRGQWRSLAGSAGEAGGLLACGASAGHASPTQGDTVLSNAGVCAANENCAAPAGEGSPAQAAASAPKPCALHVDLGCGKGVWTTRVAAADPQGLYVGMDCERMCVSFAMERAAGLGLANVRFVYDSARTAKDLFGPGEVDVLHINFPTPFPRKKQAENRVTSGARLMEYRSALGGAGQLHLKTDSQPLFDFTLEQLAATGYEVVWLTRDLHANPRGATPQDLTMSAYEERLVEQGARVHALHAVPGAPPAFWQPEEKVSLIGYLPENLDDLDYVPHGMQGAVENMRNRKRNAEARAARKVKEGSRYGADCSE